MASDAITAPPGSPRRRARSPVRALLALQVPLGFLSVLLVAVMTYLATQVLPGDAATAILGQSATPERLALVRQQLGLDKPLIGGLWDWLSGLVGGDFGVSLVQGRPADEIILPRLANSVALVITVAIASTLLGALAGRSTRRGGLAHRLRD